MKSFTKYEMNAEFKSLNDKLGKDINSESLNTLKGNLDDALSTLSSQLNTVVGEMTAPDTWDDDIKVEVSGKTVNGLANIIDGCKNPAFEILTTVGPMAKEFAQNLDDYVTEVNTYNDEYYPAWKNKSDQRPKSGDFSSDPDPNAAGYKSAYQKYTEALDKWKKAMEPLETACDNSMTKITELTDTITSAEASIKGLLSPVGSDTAASTLTGLKAGAPKPTGIPDDATATVNPDGTTTYTYEKGGKKYSATYKGDTVVEETVQEENGDVTKTTYHYSGTGNPEGSTVETTHVDPDSKVKTTTVTDLSDTGETVKKVTKVEDEEHHTTTTTTEENGTFKSKEVVEVDGETITTTTTDEYGNVKVATKKGSEDPVVTNGEPDNDVRLSALDRALADGEISDAERAGLGLESNNPADLITEATGERDRLKGESQTANGTSAPAAGTPESNNGGGTSVETAADEAGLSEALNEGSTPATETPTTAEGDGTPNFQGGAPIRDGSSVGTPATETPTTAEGDGTPSFQGGAPIRDGSSVGTPASGTPTTTGGDETPSFQ